ncbi:MAG: CsgG/HfaB family protein [Opitutales bacterium]
MKKKILFVFSMLCAVFVSAQVEKATMAVDKVIATDSLVSAMKAKGGTMAMNRVLESMDANLTSSIQATRKFELVPMSDLGAIFKAQDFANSGNMDMSDKNAAQIGKIKGVKYIVVVAVDDFQDYTEKSRFATLGKNLEKRVLRFGAVAKILDTTTGSLLESVNFVVSNDGISDTDVSTQVTGGSSTDGLIALLARKMCDNVANRVADIIFPAKVIGKTGRVVTFNRGYGTGVAIGNEYEVFALGESMRFPRRAS